MPPSAAPPPHPTAVLFGLSGCLVDFGARTIPSALQHCHPCELKDQGAAAEPSDASIALSHHQQVKPFPPEEKKQWAQALWHSANEHAKATPGALELLGSLHKQKVPCAWLEELPEEVSLRLAAPLPNWLKPPPARQYRPWPAPDACWEALMALKVPTLEGAVLVSGEPRLLQAGLKAGLWTVGLAACGRLCGRSNDDWQNLEPSHREHLRTQATLELYRLGTHSVIDHLGELGPCLEELTTRWMKGERPYAI